MNARISVSIKIKYFLPHNLPYLHRSRILESVAMVFPIWLQVQGILIFTF